MVFTFELLVGDRFIAECQEPSPKPKRNEIILKRKAFCKITKHTSEDELKLIKIKYRIWCINEKHEMEHPKELLCRKCTCGDNFYEKHTGADKVRPFNIERIPNHPALCTKPVVGAVEPYANARRIGAI